MLPFFIVILATAAITARVESNASLVSPRLYFQIPLANPSPPTSGSTINTIPASCVLFNLFCPPGYPSRPSTNLQPASLAQQVQAALVNGNTYRARHAAPPMTLDPTLTSEAQQYAEYLARTGTFQHSVPGVPPYGENLAALPSGPSATIAAANDAWYTEKPQYCPTGAAGVNTANGHFTQMVWKDSVRVGYGSAVGSNGYTYVVARYSPAGNNLATHQANVSC